MREALPAATWALVEARDRVCQASAYGFGSAEACSGRLVVHHRMLRGMGGTSDPQVHHPDRLVLLCDRHHKEVHSFVRRARDCGLILHRP